ncbi:hypothetical protein, partial [Aureimonas phyllosphaerae]
GAGGGVVPVAFFVTRTKDGSIGQTYSADPGPGGSIQWARRTLGSTGTTTDIVGATGNSYVATQADYFCTIVAKRIVGGVVVGTAAADTIVLKAPTSYENFDSATGFAAGGAASRVSVETDRKIQGTGSLAVRGSGATGALYRTKSAAFVFDPATAGLCAVRMDNGDDPEYCTFSVGGLLLSLAGANNFIAGINAGGQVQSGVEPMWRTFRPSVIPTMKDFAPGSVDLRLQATQRINASGPTFFDAFVGNAEGVPTVCFACDDIRPSQHSIFLPMMQAAGLKGATIYVPWALVGTTDGSGGRLTLAQLHDLDDYGFSIALNGTRDDASIMTRASVQAWKDEMAEGRAWLAAQNFKNADPNSIVFPNAQMDQSGSTVSKTGVVSDGSDILTVSDTSDVAIGWRAAGLYVPQSPPTTVIGIIDATHLRVSAPCAAGTAPVDFVDTSPVWHRGKLLRAMDDIGITFGRSTGGTGGIHTRWGAGGKRIRKAFPNYSISNNEPQANILAAIDIVERDGTTMIPLVHAIKADNVDGLIDVAQNKLQAIVDRVASGVASGKLVNISQTAMMARDFPSIVPV